MISIRKEIVVDDVVIVVEIIVQAVDVVVVNLVYYFIQIKIIKSEKKITAMMELFEVGKIIIR